jgi:hypothetical protein
MNNTDTYQRTLQDLQSRRSNCLEELQKLDSAITALSATMSATALIAPAPPPPPVHIAKPSDWKRRFANISVRWAVLKLFAEHLPIGMGIETAMTSAEVSASLLEGGNDKASKANVSAVISDMVNQRKELVATENGGYALTDNGRAAWSAIAHSSRYLNRNNSPNEM